MSFQNHGVPVTPVIVNTICPIAYSNDAKQIALDWTISIHSPDEIDNLLSISLRPIGEENPTHVFCTRNDFTHGLASQLNWLTNQNLEWVDGNEFQIDDNPEEIKSKFCTVTGSPETLLFNLGLEEC